MPHDAFPKRPQVLSLTPDKIGNTVLRYGKADKISQKDREVEHGYISAHEQDPVSGLVESLKRAWLSGRDGFFV